LNSPADTLHPVAEHVRRDRRIGNLWMTQMKPRNETPARGKVKSRYSNINKSLIRPSALAKKNNSNRSQ